MKNQLVEDFKSLSMQFKKCCPAPINSNYHLNGWHLPEVRFLLKDINDVNPEEYKTL